MDEERTEGTSETLPEDVLTPEEPPKVPEPGNQPVDKDLPPAKPVAVPKLDMKKTYRLIKSKDKDTYIQNGNQFDGGGKFIGKA